MTHFHAVMIDETGCEFGASVEASSRDEAYDQLRERYPESRCDQLESPEDTAEREARIYREVMGEYGDYDEPDDDEPEDDFSELEDEPSAYHDFIVRGY